MLDAVRLHLYNIRAKTGLSLKDIEIALDEKYPDLSMSDSKLSKIFKHPSKVDPEKDKVKVTLEELFAIIDVTRQSKTDLLMLLAEQEWNASEEYGYAGAEKLIEEFKRREAEQREHYEKLLEKEAAMRKNIHVAFTDAKDAFDYAVKVIQQNHDAAIQQRDDVYTRTVTHLKTQLTTDAQEYHDAVAGKDEALATMATHAGAAMKSVKWWRLTALVAILALAALILYLMWELRNLDRGVTAVLIQMVRDGLI